MQVEILEKEKNKLKLQFSEIDYGVLSLLSDQIWKESDVELAGFRLDHPQVSNPVFILKTKKKEAKAVWNEAIDELMKEAKELEKEFAKLK